METSGRNSVIVEDPDLYIIPGTYVYYASVDDNDLFFCEGYWWRGSRSSGWYRASLYSGPWVIIMETQVPDRVIRLPSEHRDFRSEDKVKWNDARQHWREWETEKRWDRPEQNKKRDQDQAQKQKDDQDQVKEKQRKPEPVQKQKQVQKKKQVKKKNRE